MTMISINIESLTPEKENIPAELCKTSKCETNHKRPKLSGMKLVVEKPRST